MHGGTQKLPVQSTFCVPRCITRGTSSLTFYAAIFCFGNKRQYAASGV